MLETQEVKLVQNMFFFFFFFFLVQVFPCEDTEQEELLNSDLLSSGSVCISVLCCRVLGLTYFHDVSALKEERNGMECNGGYIKKWPLYSGPYPLLLLLLLSPLNNRENVSGSVKVSRLCRASVATAAAVR